MTIKVVDGEDMGTVKLSAREPQVDRSLHATASDEDGGMSGVEWRWYRGVLVDTDDDETGDQLGCAEATDEEAGGAFTGGWQMIEGAKSPAYTADSDTFDHDDDDTNDEVEYCLRATVTYTDNIDSDQDTTTCRRDRLGGDGSRSDGGPGAGERSCEHGSEVR